MELDLEFQTTFRWLFDAQTSEQVEFSFESNRDAIRMVNTKMMEEFHRNRNQSLQCPKLYTYQPGGMVPIEMIPEINSLNETCSLSSSLPLPTAPPLPPHRQEQQQQQPSIPTLTPSSSSSATSTAATSTRLPTSCNFNEFLRVFLVAYRTRPDQYNLVPINHSSFLEHRYSIGTVGKLLGEGLASEYRTLQQFTEVCARAHETPSWPNKFGPSVLTSLKCWIAHILAYKFSIMNEITGLPPEFGVFGQVYNDGCLGRLVLLPDDSKNIKDLFVQWFYGVSPIAKKYPVLLPNQNEEVRKGEAHGKWRKITILYIKILESYLRDRTSASGVVLNDEYKRLAEMNATTLVATLGDFMLGQTDLLTYRSVTGKNDKNLAELENDMTTFRSALNYIPEQYREMVVWFETLADDYSNSIFLSDIDTNLNPANALQFLASLQIQREAEYKAFEASMTKSGF